MHHNELDTCVEHLEQLCWNIIIRTQPHATKRFNHWSMCPHALTHANNTQVRTPQAQASWLAIWLMHLTRVDTPFKPYFKQLLVTLSITNAVISTVTAQTHALAIHDTLIYQPISNNQCQSSSLVGCHRYLSCALQSGYSLHSQFYISNARFH